MSSVLVLGTCLKARFLSTYNTNDEIMNQYCEPENFRRDFTAPLKGSSDSAKSRAMRKLQALLKAILLRRTKKSQIDGKSILDLPVRTTEQSHAIFSDDELAFYKALETQTQLTFNKYLRANAVGRNYSNILVLLLRLRQAVSTLKAGFPLSYPLLGLEIFRVPRHITAMFPYFRSW